MRRRLREVRKQRRRNSRYSHAFQGPTEVEDSRMGREGKDANGHGSCERSTHHEPARRNCIGCQAEGDGRYEFRSIRDGSQHSDEAGIDSDVRGTEACQIDTDQDRAGAAGDTQESMTEDCRRQVQRSCLYGWIKYGCAVQRTSPSCKDYVDFVLATSESTKLWSRVP